MLNTDKIPSPVKDIAATIQKAGFKCWIVGGCVRDLLLKRNPSDWDLTTDAKPEDVMKLFPSVIPTGIAHGTVTVHQLSGDYEVTTLRGESAYTDGRHPDEVTFITSLDEDLARRDFTVNAIAADPVTGEIFDPFKGQDDIEDGIIRAVGHPIERFDEDGLRILRASRFAGTLGFYITGATATAMRACVGNLKNVSMERVHAEFKKAIERSPKPSQAFRSMYCSGILKQLNFPMVEKAFEDNLVRLDAAPRTFECGMVALLFYMSKAEVEEYMRYLKASNAERTMVAHLVDVLQSSLPPHVLLASPVELRKWLFRVTRKYANEAIQLYFAEGVRDHVLAELKTSCLGVSELDIDGHVLIEMGVQPKQIGEVLRQLVADVIEHPEWNNRAQLMTRVDPFHDPCCYGMCVAGNQHSEDCKNFTRK
jgi:tRNA nucleotidyltransferase (CCA-adding enzyme)